MIMIKGSFSMYSYSLSEDKNMEISKKVQNFFS